MIEYRILQEMADFEALVDLEIAIWGLNPRNTVPSALLHVMALNGGLVMGAYDEARMVGLLVSLPVKRGAEVLLWSHMTGTHPDYQRQGIGLALKRIQRQWALEQGYTEIRWTVDPLQRGNAWFNLHLLAADAALTCNQYHVNFYGEMDDDINRGMPSDRIEICWRIDQPSYHRATHEPAPSLICPNENGLPVKPEPSWDSSTYAVPVPTDLGALRHQNPDAVMAWRLALREALLSAFDHRYMAIDFVKQDDTYAYLLCKEESLP